MSTLDIVVVVLLAFGAIQGFIKGFVLQSLMLVALVLGIWAATEFHEPAGALLAKWFNAGPKLMSMVALSLIFVLVLTAMFFLSKFLTRVMGKSVLGKLNRMGGVLFGVLKMAFIISVFIFIVQKFDSKNSLISKEQENSLVFKTVAQVAPAIFPHLHLNEIKEGIL